MFQVYWSHQLAAFEAFLGEALKQSKDAPERGIIARATAMVTAEVQSGISVHTEEGTGLQSSYLGILQNALNQLQVNVLTAHLYLAPWMLPTIMLLIVSMPFSYGTLIARHITEMIIICLGQVYIDPSYSSLASKFSKDDPEAARIPRDEVLHVSLTSMETASKY